jgi:putative DNA-invertase from lambdoid prophage Rac
VLLVWALDRLAREGPLDTLQVVERFAKLGVQVVSHQESWTEGAGELRDLLLAIVGWVARFESVRRSERTKAGIERARSQGKALGRRPGSKDGQRRRRSGYVARWERPGEREHAREWALRLNKGQPESDGVLNSVDRAAVTGQ